MTDLTAVIFVCLLIAVFCTVLEVLLIALATSLAQIVWSPLLVIGLTALLVAVIVTGKLLWNDRA